MTKKSFDLFVIGGGSGGLAAAKAAARLGKKVGLADFVKPSPAGTTWGLGGTCVNVGCIPKKLFHIGSSGSDDMHRLQFLGWESTASHNWSSMVTNVTNYIRGINWNYKNELKDNNIDYFNAHASFDTDDKTGHTIRLSNKNQEIELVEANQVLIATGGRPNYGPYEGAKEYGISSDDIFWRKTPPGKTLVVGASYIALECAGFLTGLGFNTTVMVRSILLRGFDQEMATRIKSHMEIGGTKFIPGTTPNKLEKVGDKIKVEYALNGNIVSDEYDTVLFAIGRTGLANELNLGSVGVDFDEKAGKIYTNNKDQTNVEHIYAIGDVAVNRPELTPVAILAGKLLVNRLYGNSQQLMDYDVIPTTVFTPTEYGVVGLSEEKAIEIYGEDNITIYHSLYTPLELNLDYMEEREYFLKFICSKGASSKEERIIGMHFLGPHAGEVIQGYGTAIRLGMTKYDLETTVGIHPTNAETFTTADQIKQDGVELSAGGGC